MRKKQTYDCSILQYSHDPHSRERINIGVSIYSPNQKKFVFEIESWNSRLISTYPDLDKANYTQLRRSLERALKTASTLIGSDKNGLKLQEPEGLWGAFGQENANSLDISRKSFVSENSCFHWEWVGAGVADSLEDALQKMCDKYVRKYLTKSIDHGIPDEQVWGQTYKRFENSQISKHFQGEKSIKGKIGGIDYPQSYQNGMLHVLKGLSLDLKSDDNINAKVAKWHSFAEWTALEKVKPTIILGKPQDSKFMRSFENAYTAFGEIEGARVYREDEFDALANKIEQDLRQELHC